MRDVEWIARDWRRDETRGRAGRRRQGHTVEPGAAVTVSDEVIAVTERNGAPMNRLAATDAQGYVYRGRAGVLLVDDDVAERILQGDDRLRIRRRRVGNRYRLRQEGRRG